MAQLARKPCSDIITSQTSRLAPPSSQKSRNRVVSARGAATGAGAATGRALGGASATATVVILTDGLLGLPELGSWVACVITQATQATQPPRLPKTRECLARAVPHG